MSLLALALLSCTTDKGVACGPGTHLEGDLCVADSDTDTAEPDTDTDVDSDTDTDPGGDTDTGEDPLDDDPIGDDESESVLRLVIAYYTEWSIYDRDYQVADIPADKLTHINYAFADLSSEGDCEVYDSWAALERDGGTYAAMRALKESHPGLKVLLSVGGWTLSGNFSSVASTEAGRARMASSCVDFARTYGFDGLDIDWEYPVSGGLYDGAPDDTENYTLLLAAIRAEMDATDPDLLLTIAAPAGDDKIVNFDLAAIHPYLDWMNVMTYDYAGGWDTTTGFLSPLSYDPASPSEHAETYNVQATVRAYLDGGVPPEKIVIGVPLYGRGWGSVGATDDGLYQAAGSTWLGTWEAGAFDYQDIVESYLTDASYERHYSSTTQSPWLYSADAGVFITYDDEESVAAKLAFVDDNELGGVMMWELSGDTEDHTLVTLVSHELR